jgi:hypothetical protein
VLLAHLVVAVRCDAGVLGELSASLTGQPHVSAAFLAGALSPE